MKRLLLSIFLLQTFHFTSAQTPKKLNSSEIYEAIQKLNFLGSVLYVAAHPDDENTSMISYFSNKVHAETAYVSMTRGDGGQNLIGPELRELLGIIRTQELQQARRIDGGRQFFTRANDFGFSKNPDETFEFWDKDKVLSDLVFVIRKFQPDIIINRFDHRTPGTTHGHHTASAMLSVEAFDLAGDASKFPEQLEYTRVWQPKRQFFNDSWFLYGSREEYEKADQSDKFRMDIGVFHPTLGLSNGEISALSRSSHSSQGFGVAGNRGVSLEFIEPLKGGLPKTDIFEGIDTTWNRVENGKEIGEILQNVQKNYDFNNPAASIPDLLRAYDKIQNLKDDHSREIKLNEIKEIIAAAAGLYLDAHTSQETAVAGEIVNINFDVINRSEIQVQLNSVAVNGKELGFAKVLDYNRSLKVGNKIKIPENQIPTNAYWLDEPGTVGMYKVSDQAMIGLPETPPALTAMFHITVDDREIILERPIYYKYVDHARGEIYQPFVITPKASVSLSEKVVIFGDSQPKTVKVKVKSFTKDLNGDLSLDAPKGWTIQPEFKTVNLTEKGETGSFEFVVTPPKNQIESELTPTLKIGDSVLKKELYEINYDHIPAQKILLPAAGKFVRIDLQKKGNKVGYIEGAGDSVADDLKQIGYEVEIISPENITTENLQQYDAVVVGIRAFNVVSELKFKNKILFDYVKNGGNVVVQYNVARGQLLTDEIAPYPLKLSTDRVTDEFSEVKFLDENHSVLNFPNKITQKDFEGWVQERGLYFPNEWDEKFTPILSMHDKGEAPMKGSLLVAQYGKGYYVYTGLSFFRELPAGVPGAYRLLANLLSLGK